MMFREAKWMTRESQGDRYFFVIQGEQLPWLFGRDIKRAIYQRGEFPWHEVISDLPGTHRGQDGSLHGQRAASCRLFEDTRYAATSEPLMNIADIEERLIEDPRTGQHAVRLETFPKKDTVGQPYIIVPHMDHRVVKIGWICSASVKLIKTQIDPTMALALEKHDHNPDACWSYIPRFERPVALYRLYVAFWELPVPGSAAYSSPVL